MQYPSRSKNDSHGFKNSAVKLSGVLVGEVRTSVKAQAAVPELKPKVEGLKDQCDPRGNLVPGRIECGLADLRPAIEGLDRQLARRLEAGRLPLHCGPVAELHGPAEGALRARQRLAIDSRGGLQDALGGEADGDGRHHRHRRGQGRPRFRGSVGKPTRIGFQQRTSRGRAASATVGGSHCDRATDPHPAP